MLRLLPTQGRVCPGIDFTLHALVGWVTNYYLASDIHAAEDVGILTVTVSCLVEVHEVHVDGCPWQ